MESQHVRTVHGQNTIYIDNPTGLRAEDLTYIEGIGTIKDGHMKTFYTLQKTSKKSRFPIRSIPKKIRPVSTEKRK